MKIREYKVLGKRIFIRIIEMIKNATKLDVGEVKRGEDWMCRGEQTLGTQQLQKRKKNPVNLVAFISVFVAVILLKTTIKTRYYSQCSHSSPAWF